MNRRLERVSQLFERRQPGFWAGLGGLLVLVLGVLDYLTGNQIVFSIGVVTCVAPLHAAEQLINLADQLMYGIKNTTKNGIRFMTLEGSDWPGA